MENSKEKQEGVAVVLQSKEVSKPIWKQSYSIGNGEFKTDIIPMEEMSSEHLQKAILKCQREIDKHVDAAAGWEKRQEQLTTIAKIKNIKIVYSN